MAAQAGAVPRGSSAAIVVLSITVVLELLFATLPVLMVALEGDLPWILLGITTWPRLALTVAASWTVQPKRWYIQWRKIDALAVYSLASALAHSFAAWDTARKEGARTLSAWQWHAIIVYVPMVLALTGHLRVMSKWFPFTVRAVFAYKLVRVYHLLVFLLITLINSLNGSVSGATLAFFTTSMTLVAYMLGLVLTRERQVLDKALAFHQQRLLDRLKAVQALPDVDDDLLGGENGAESDVIDEEDENEADARAENIAVSANMFLLADDDGAMPDASAEAADAVASIVSHHHHGH